MNPDTFRSDPSAEGQETYWRRRVFVLAGVLFVVAIVAWACSGSEDDGRRTGAAKAGVTAGAAAADPVALASALPTALPTVTATVTVRATVAPPVPPKRPGDACNAEDMVINLSQARESYGAAERPRFMISVVNTGYRLCTFDVGSRALELIIGSGADRVWSSAECVGGTGSDVRRFPRGIPYVTSVEWDRKRSARDCQGNGSVVRSGTYAAIAQAGGLKTGRAAFRLR